MDEDGNILNATILETVVEVGGAAVKAAIGGTEGAEL